MSQIKSSPSQISPIRSEMGIILFHLILLFFTALFTKSMSSQNSKFDECSKNFTCGDLDDLGYPFYDGLTRPSYCGYPGFKLDCSPNNPPKITISGQVYNIANGNDFDMYRITVSRNDKWQDQCPDRLTNTAMDLSKFIIPSTTQIVTFFYDCKGYGNTNLSTLTLKSTCDVAGYGTLDGYYLTQDMSKANSTLKLFQNCFNIFLLVSESGAKDVNADPSNLGTLIKAFKDGFDVNLIANNVECSSCVGSNGVCGYDFDSSKFVCHCDDHDYSHKCGVGLPIEVSKGRGIHQLTVILIGKSKLLMYHISHVESFISIMSHLPLLKLLLTRVIIGVVLILGVLGGFLLIIQKSKQNPQNKTFEESLKNIESFVPKRYTYKYVEKITKSFREKLGEGGYGIVFKGNLKNGCEVTVKVWKQSKGDGLDFINEIMSISRTSHVNVVPLLGFCCEGRKRALVYEFMPNGSLEKFLQGRCSNENNKSLSVQKLFEITIGIARGLEYLHCGCNMRIVHFDIKPHNILLNEDFIPKISDFGLVKSSKQKESIISMYGVRGTVGYIAPEVILKSFGGVSHKSDVYSFGMMVLEMVGCKKKLNENAQNSSEMYFPQWIYKQLEQRTTRFDCDNILNVGEKDLERKMILIGLACIQTNPMSRPSISRVVEMLEGKVELLEVPPMPTLSSPPRLQQSTNNNSVSLYSSTTYSPAMNS